MMDWIDRLARWTAMVGGAVLTALTLLVVASVAGRALIGVGLGPVPGDFELVEMGTGVAVLFFLPWTYLKGGHATVDLLHAHLPRWAQKAIDTLSDVLMLLVWLVLTLAPRISWPGWLVSAPSLRTKSTLGASRTAPRRSVTEPTPTRTALSDLSSVPRAWRSRVVSVLVDFL